jgi:hypothetical protein
MQIFIIQEKRKQKKVHIGLIKMNHFSFEYIKLIVPARAFFYMI